MGLHTILITVSLVLKKQRRKFRFLEFWGFAMERNLKNPISYFWETYRELWIYRTHSWARSWSRNQVKSSPYLMLLKYLLSTSFFLVIWSNELIFLWIYVTQEILSFLRLNTKILNFHESGTNCRVDVYLLLWGQSNLYQWFKFNY